MIFKPPDVSFGLRKAIAFAGKCFQVAGFTWMIRAMRGRSSRPNHMPSHLDAIQTMISVDFRRLVGSFHSVAKQASFRVALRTDFRGFWSDLGRVWEAKIDAKIDFQAIFFRCFFQYVFASIFPRFWEARDLKNH